MSGLLSGLAQVAAAAGDEAYTDYESTDGNRQWERIDNGLLSDTGIEVTESLGSLADGTVSSILFSILDSSNASVFVIDAEGTIRYDNEGCRELFDRAEGELLDDNLFEYENADNEIVRERVLGEGEPIQKDEEIELDDGSVRYSERSVYPLFGEDGSVVGAIEINRDVTERVLSQRREKAIREYQETALSALEDSLVRLGDGDLTVTPSVPDPDPDEEFAEVRQVADQFDQMATDLQQAIANTNQALAEARWTAEELNRLSDQLQGGGDEALDAMSAIEQANQRVASLTKKQDQRTTEAETNVSNLSASIEEVTASSREIQQQAEKATDLTTEGIEAAERAIDQMETTISASEQNIQQVESLEAQMAEISGMTELIEDIADQTNILALNANIEAARADGSGDGFAVVANEVKQLAEKSKATVSEISAVLDTLDERISETAGGIDQSNDQIKAAAEVVEDVVSTIDEIDAAIQQTEQGVSEISTATDDQANNTENVLDVVEQVSEASGTVETRMAEVSDSVDTQAEIVDRVTDAAATIDDLGDDLERQLSVFELK